MNVLLKFLLHDMIVQYRRTLLIILTLLLSAAAMLASVCLSDTMVALGTSQWRAEYGYADILIQARPDADNRYISEFSAESQKAAYTCVVFRLTTGAVIKSGADDTAATAYGFNLEALLQMVPLHLASQDGLFPFEGNKAVISLNTARQFNLAVGDIITLSIGGNRHALVVAAIAYAEGPFVSESKQPSIILPYSKVQAWIGALGKVDSILIRLNDPDSKGRVIRKLAASLKDCRVSESYSADNIRLQANRTSVPFIFMSVLLCFMSVYVLFILFKGITTSRLPLMGVFRAIGASRTVTWLVMLAESMLYGILGGLASWLAGYGLLWIMIRTLNGGAIDQFIPLIMGSPQMLTALGCAILISLLGAFGCLVSETRRSISQQIRGLLIRHKQPARAWIGGGLLLVLATLPVLFWRSENGMVVYILCVVGLYAGLALLSPALYSHLGHGLARFLNPGSGPVTIALLNIRGRRDFAVAATIISIIVATSSVITAISGSDRLGEAIYASRIRYALELRLGGLSDRTLNLVRQTAEVTAACANYYSGSVEVAGQGIAIYRIHGVTPAHQSFISYELISSRTDPVGDLTGGRNILLTTTLQNIYGVAEGDSLVLKIYGRDGRYRECAYTIIGFFDDWYTKLGRYALISQENFRQDFAADVYDSLYIQAADDEAAAAALSAALSRQQIDLRLVREEKAELARESAMIIRSMGFISSLAIATGLLGILNITLLAFMRRKREFGLYYAMGMTPSDILAMILSELMLAGILGTLSGLLLGLLVVAVALPRLIFSLQIALRIFLSARDFLLAASVGVLVAAAAAGLCLLFLHRNNPMDGLRQEE